MNIIWKGIAGGFVTAAIVVPLDARAAWFIVALCFSQPPLDLTTISFPGFDAKFAVACGGATR
jgi:hypothetical protein